MKWNVRMLRGIKSSTSCSSKLQYDLGHKPSCCDHTLELTFYSEMTLSHGRSGLTPILFAQSFWKNKKMKPSQSHCLFISVAVQLSPCSWPRWCDRGSLPARHTSSCWSSLDLPQPEQGRQGQPDKQQQVKFSFPCFTHQPRRRLTGSSPLWMDIRSDILSVNPGAKFSGLMATKHWP